MFIGIHALRLRVRGDVVAKAYILFIGIHTLCLRGWVLGFRVRGDVVAKVYEKSHS